MLRAREIIVAILAALVPVCWTLAATQTTLKDPPPPKFAWSDFAPATGVSGITVHDYRNEAGTGAGPVYVSNFDTLDAGNSIGTTTFEFALWRGSTTGENGPINRVGAAILGGFNLQNPVYSNAGVGFSFYQIFRDGAIINGAVDGGGINGKVNGDIPNWNTDAGWNYAGAAAPYDYFDVPANAVSLGNETVSFETCLVCQLRGVHHIMLATTWSFTSDGAGGVSGVKVTQQPMASDRLMELYGALRGGDTLQNVNVGSCLALIPEPATIQMTFLCCLVMMLPRSAGTRYLPRTRGD